MPAMINPAAPDFSNTPANPRRKGTGLRLRENDGSPVVSIVTPFFDTGEVFHETAQSIFSQTLQQWEWLIINDGSQDGQALQILAEYRQRDPRIRVMDHPQNRGLSAARNTGFNAARCGYVALLDSDDLLEPTALEKWWWLLQSQSQFGFVASYHVAFGGMNYLWSGGFHDGAANAERNRVSMMCMVRKSVHQAVGGFDESIRGGLEDWDFWMRCAAQGIWGTTVPEFLAWYRLRPDHSDRWGNLHEERIAEFRANFQQRFPHLYSGHFPNPPMRNFELDLTLPSLDVPTVNRLAKAQWRLLLIVPWLVMGGAERFALNLMDQLRRRGWQITIIATAPAEHVWLTDFEQRSEDLFILPHFLPFKDYARFLGYLIYSRQFDAVLLQGSHEGYRLAAVLRDLYPGLPMVDYLHFVTPEWMQGGFPRLSLLCQESIALTIASSRQVSNWMVEQGCEPQKLKVCYIGADAEIWKPDAEAFKRVRSDLGIGLDETVILYAARLEQQKQPLRMVEVLDELGKAGKTFRALIAGDGSLRAELEKNVETAGLSGRVIFLGSVPTGQMPAIMAAADIFFLPSQNEGIAQAIYEAMSSGLVVVGAKVGGQAELVTAECGFLIEPRAEQYQRAEYVRILGELIENPARRKELGMRARQRILNGFTLEDMGANMVDALQSISQHSVGSFEPVPLAGKALEQSRLVIEFLQARQEGMRLYKVVEEVSNQYSDLYRRYEELISPKPPSHWFYLWVRQLLMPLYRRLGGDQSTGFFARAKSAIKSVFLKRG
jgi:glycosyltransferase involved in cell wall biosynthesis